MFFVKKIKILSRYYFSILVGFFNYFNKNKSIYIFNYHNFNYNKKIKSSMFVSYENFFKQIIYFKRNGNIINFDNLINNEIDNNNNNILITIDDGDLTISELANNLKKINIPITLFLPIGLMLENDNIDYYRSLCLHHYFFVRRKKSLKTKEQFFNKIMNFNIQKLINLEKILSYKNLSKDYVIKRKKISLTNLNKLINNHKISIGSHGMSHVLMSKIPKRWSEWEIRKSLEYIRSIKGNDKIISIPYGNYNSFDDLILLICKKNNIKIILSSINLKNKIINDFFGRTYVLNSSNKFYLNGLINNSMFYFDKLLRRL